MSLTEKQQVQIDILNKTVKAKLAPSPIHGVGVFAIRDIKAGERVAADQLPKIYDLSWGNLSKLLPEVEEIIKERWPSVINGSKFISPDARLVSFMNHSEDPNYDPASDTAMRDIKKGEEITESYWMMPNAEKVFKWLKKD